MLEIRPAVPGPEGPRAVPDPRPGLRRCRLVLDPERGTATWHRDGRKGPVVELRLGAALGELAGIVRAVYPPAMPNAFDAVLVGRVLLVDSTGRLLAKSAALPQVLFDQAWPVTRLQQRVLPVREERFGNTRLLQQAHRGAAPLWPLTAGFLWLVTTVALLVLAVGGLVAALTRFG